MIDPKILDDLAKRFSEAVPPGFRQFQAELEKTFHAVMQSAFTKMDLVTREEFDVQSQVLARTRAKLEALEQQVKELEEKLIAKPASRRKAVGDEPKAESKDAGDESKIES
ncbi:MAG TPA: accessory factor UbiK family protein [Candidatus Competibacteraceae bacterium]|nr:accessory factor UbiK family protein [Candidatus Competibacteraceae bacterium]